MHEIRRIWRAERGDWADRVPGIVKGVLGRDLDWIVEDNAAFTAEDARLQAEACTEHSVPPELVTRLLDIERAAHGLKRRHAIHTRIEDLFRQEWRSLDEILAERADSRSADGLGEVATDAAEDDDVDLLSDIAETGASR